MHPKLDFLNKNMNEQKSQQFKQKAAFKVVVYYRNECNKKSEVYFSRTRFENKPEKGKKELMEKVFNIKINQPDVKTVLLYDNISNQQISKHVNP